MTNPADMQNLINLMTCEAGHRLSQDLLTHQPAMWLAAALLVAAIVMAARPHKRTRLIGYAVIFGGLLSGYTPVIAVNNWLASQPTCPFLTHVLAWLWLSAALVAFVQIPLRSNSTPA